MENKLSSWQRAKILISKKPIQYGLALLYVVIIFAVFIPHLISHSPIFIDQKMIVDCPSVLNTYQISIDNQGFKPQKMELKVCNQIVFQNSDNKYHQIAFGPHPFHTIYPGFKEKLLAPGDTNTLLLIAYGSYEIHDHLDKKFEANLIITQ